MMRHDTYQVMHDELKNVMLGEPSISEADAKEQLWEKFSGKEEIFRLLYDNWFNANWYRYEPKVETVTTVKQGKKIKGQSVTIVRKTYGDTASKAQRKVVAKKIIMEKSAIVLMNLPMPNGKPLRDCTGSECLRIGGWIATVGKAIKPAERVGKQLTETDLQNLYMRNAA